jgi:hypothetical protein
MHSRTLTSCQSRETTIDESVMPSTVAVRVTAAKITNVMAGVSYETKV